jgi:predicted phage terminase large subunit-like protein
MDPKQTTAGEPQHAGAPKGKKDVLGTSLDLAEAVQLGAVDPIFFEQFFFPETARMAPAKFHPELNAVLDSMDRYCNLTVFRGGAKTTKVRLYMARRLAYGISRTVVVVGKNQDHARRSLAWLQKQVLQNHLFASTFGLKKGVKWTDAEMNVINESAGISVWFVAFGITGSVRGVNFDDYRPDLILIDDVVAEDNSLSPAQIEKTIGLVLGALKESLTPATECPTAKLIILQTPHVQGDISQIAAKDLQFRSIRFGCWTRETEDLLLEARESAWPERYPSEMLRQEKRAAMARNRLSTFVREMECKLISAETSSFKEEWLQYYGEGEVEPEPDWAEMWVEMAIDPIPPPTALQIKQGLVNKDYEAFAVMGKLRGKYYLLETSQNKGHQPSWTIAEFFRLAKRWRPKKVLVEGVAYQKTLEWLLREAMKQVGQYWMIDAFDDKRRKATKIVDGLTGLTSNRQLFIHRQRHIEFCDQFVAYPAVQFDDLIEAVATVATALQRGGLPGGNDDYDHRTMEEHIPKLNFQRGAP